MSGISRIGIFFTIFAIVLLTVPSAESASSVRPGPSADTDTNPHGQEGVYLQRGKHCSNGSP
jgi:hypothetical protein